MVDIASIVDRLRTLDLKAIDVQEIVKVLAQVGKLPVSTMKIQEGRSIYRARFHSDPNLKFDRADQLSYRTDLNNIASFGRANLPNESRFYGALSSGTIRDGYVISIFETSRNLRNNLDGVERVTFSQWIVKSEFEVIVLGSSASKEEKAFTELHDYIDRYMAEHPEEHHFNELFEYIGDQFSKRVPSGQDHEYKISSAFAHIIMSIGGFGIAYPSVQTKYAGFNVVLRNEIANDFLKLDKVCVADLHKRGSNSVMSQLQYCIAEGDELREYINLDHPYKLTAVEIETELNK